MALAHNEVQKIRKKNSAIDEQWHISVKVDLWFESKDQSWIRDSYKLINIHQRIAYNIHYSTSETMTVWVLNH